MLSPIANRIEYLRDNTASKRVNSEINKFLNKKQITCRGCNTIVTFIDDLGSYNTTEGTVSNLYQMHCHKCETEDDFSWLIAKLKS